MKKIPDFPVTLVIGREEYTLTATWTEREVWFGRYENDLGGARKLSYDEAKAYEG